MSAVNQVHSWSGERLGRAGPGRAGPGRAGLGDEVGRTPEKSPGPPPELVPVRSSTLPRHHVIYGTHARTVQVIAALVRRCRELQAALLEAVGQLEESQLSIKVRAGAL